MEERIKYYCYSFYLQFFNFTPMIASEMSLENINHLQVINFLILSSYCLINIML